MLRQIIPALLITGIAGAAGAAPPPDWMSGHWCAERGEETVEEVWLPPHGRVAVGLGRTRTRDRTTAFEYLRMVEVEGVLNYVAQPGGRPPTSFRQTAGGEHWIRFENPGHDFPQRIEYRREGDALHATIAGPGEDGEDVSMSFDYGPCSTRNARTAMVTAAMESATCYSSSARPRGGLLPLHRVAPGT